MNELTVLPAPVISRTCSDVDYRRSNGLAQSDLKEFARSPLHYQAYAAQPHEQTDAMRIGSLTHMAVFEPERYRMVTAIGPNESRSTKIWKAFAEANPGKELLKEAEASTIACMVQGLRVHPVASALLGAGEPGISVWVNDPCCGVLCKALYDWYLPDRYILDLKTTDDAGYGAFSKSVANYKYHWQAAHYMMLAEYAGIPVESFIFVVIEKTPPFGIAIYEIDRQDLGLAIGERRMLLQAFKACLETDTWPCYPLERQSLKLPRWAWQSNSAI